jgi:hypothetical protein
LEDENKKSSPVLDRLEANPHSSGEDRDSILQRLDGVEKGLKELKEQQELKELEELKERKELRTLLLNIQACVKKEAKHLNTSVGMVAQKTVGKVITADPPLVDSIQFMKNIDRVSVALQAMEIKLQVRNNN